MSPNANMKKMKMALHELECGDNLAPGQKIIGRVFAGASKTTTKGQAIVSKYIVTGAAFSDILLLEGWGAQAARLSKACVDGEVVEITGALPIKEMTERGLILNLRKSGHTHKRCVHCKAGRLSKLKVKPGKLKVKPGGKQSCGPPTRRQ